MAEHKMDSFRINFDVAIINPESVNEVCTVEFVIFCSLNRAQDCPASNKSLTENSLEPRWGKVLN